MRLNQLGKDASAIGGTTPSIKEHDLLFSGSGSRAPKIIS